MENFKQLQLEVENNFKANNKPFPATWNWEENTKGLFYIEPTTGKKRYGLVKSCKFCEREFIGRHNWTHKTVVCSRICKGEIQKVEKTELNCAWCKKTIFKEKGKLHNSRSGLYFCDRKCKEEAQKVGGIKEIQPSHYQDGSKAYSERAFKHYGYRCVDCNVTMKAFLHVHHIDSDRDNGSLENLEVVCSTHHMLRHMRYKKKTNEWVVDFKFLTPRDKLDELRKLLTA